MEKKIWALCRQLLEEKKFRELRELLCEENEVDLAELLETLPVEQAVLAFRALPKELAAEGFSPLHRGGGQ